ncbi:hypothetical protein G0Q06_10110 [Puniceicoccales bacterium CK1056]|uniref:PEP-CTERM protein-sorting domain-containing protein n=1 Tax=Oceanipulchritudo coccoides TaxID=2706888 RepID=A0A6B2M3X4_9BACT|nr:hypothetical protein [Oceanipulchritudo coccoides]NDV62804.1 hypothetical protein [Oceanipulchritudo coccoides]
MNNTSRTLLLAGALLGASILSAQVTVLVDFGNDSSFRGASVDAGGAGIDENGNYWTSVWSGAFYPNMVDSTGSATTIDFGFDGAPAGTDYFNGPSGSTADPTATVYNATALGDLGADEAVYDYYVSGRFQIQGLDPTKTYDLAFFGSHKFSTDDATVYTVYTDNTYTTSVASVSLNVQTPGSPWLHNQDTVASLTGLSPQTSNILYVEFAGSGGNSGYLNAMQITEVPEPSTYALYAGFLALGMILFRRRLKD